MNYGTITYVKNKTNKTSFILTLISFFIILATSIASIVISTINFNSNCYKSKILISLPIYLLINASIKLIGLVIFIIGILIYYITDITYDKCYRFSMPILIIFTLLLLAISNIGLLEIGYQYQVCIKEKLPVSIMTIIMTSSTLITIGNLFSTLKDYYFNDKVE